MRAVRSSNSWRWLHVLVTLQCVGNAARAFAQDHDAAVTAPASPDAGSDQRDAASSDAGVPDTGAPAPGTEPPLDAGAPGGGAPIPPRLIARAELPEGTPATPDSEAVLELVIDTDGNVREVSVIETSHAAFGAAAAQSVRRWRFEPARAADGRPIAARMRIRYRPPAPAEPSAGQVAPSSIEAEPSEVSPEATSDAEAEFGAVARTQAPPREVTRRPIDAERVALIAGAHNDPLKAVEIMPGVQRPPLGQPLVLIRGAGANDSAILVDGTPVLLLYHLDGLQSFLNPALLDRVDFFPGNFSVRYGRAIGGAIDAHLRGPRSDRFHGIADISFLNASLLLEGPLSDRVSVAAAGRRSYIDALLSLLPDEDDVIAAAPVYWDYQGLLSYRASDVDELYLQTFGSSDSFAINLGDDADPGLSELRGQLGGKTQFHRALVGWRHRYGGGYLHDIKLGVGYITIQANVGELVRQNARAPDLYGRADFHLPLLANRLTLDTGIDFVGYTGELEYEGPQFRQQEVDPGSDLPPMVDVDRHVTIMRPAAYAELTFTPVPRLALIPGVRADYFGDIDAFAFNPRFSARYGITSKTMLKAGVGKFSEPPPLGAAIEGLGNPQLDPIHALHVSAGVEHEFGELLSLDVEGYYKRLYDMIVNSEDGEPPLLVNDGDGRIFGVELALELETDDLFASIAYTLSRSERRVRDAGYLLFDYDQPHNLTLAAGYDLGKGWQLSSTFRLVSGNPETPLLGAVYDADNDRYLPLFGEPNSKRAPLFHRLDLRAEKRFAIGDSGGITLYLDVQNALNVRRPEASAYSYDFRRRVDVRGLPILPILGVRGEL